MTIFAIDSLSARQLTENDESDLFALLGKELVKKYIPDRFETREELREVLTWLIGQYGREKPTRLTYKVCLGDRLIGLVSTGPLPSDEEKRELAYIIDPEYWAKGYATRVTRLFIEFLRGRGFDEALYAEIDVGNIGSIRVAERNGFSRVGQFEDRDTGHRKYLYRLAPPGDREVLESPPELAVRGINHITLSVRNIDSAFAFYRDVLGLRPIMKSTISAYFTAGPTWIALVEEKEYVASTNYSHICFGVGEEDFKEFAARLRAKGVQEWQEDLTEGESVYLLDDSGNKLEIHYSSLENRIAEGKDKWEKGIEWFV